MTTPDQPSSLTSRPALAAPGASSVLESLLNQLETFPLWMKHVVFTEVADSLLLKMDKNTLFNSTQEENLSFWVPHLSRQGEELLQRQTSPGAASEAGELHPLSRRLLLLAQQGYKAAYITLVMNLSLEQFCRLTLDAIKRQWIDLPEQTSVFATIRYLAGETRLGEYLVQIGKITPEQLVQSVKTQQYILSAVGEKTPMGDVLVHLGFVPSQEVAWILFLKEESMRVYVAPSEGPKGEAPLASLPAQQSAEPNQPVVAAYSVPSATPASSTSAMPVARPAAQPPALSAGDLIPSLKIAPLPSSPAPQRAGFPLG